MRAWRSACKRPRAGYARPLTPSVVRPGPNRSDLNRARGERASRWGPAMSLSLSDDEYTAVMTACQPLPARSRDAFLRELAAALQGRELGPGIVFRTIAVVQRRYFDPPDLSRSGYGSKYR
jgi:hypothetical protein